MMYKIFVSLSFLIIFTMGQAFCEDNKDQTATKNQVLKQKVDRKVATKWANYYNSGKE